VNGTAAFNGRRRKHVRKPLTVPPARVFGCRRSSLVIVTSFVIIAILLAATAAAMAFASAQPTAVLNVGGA
jgi:hypothetical protein